jgi:phosphoglycerate dehydrogenase-like enzyme
VKGLLPEKTWHAGIVVTNAASAIATCVREFAPLATLTMLRTLPKHTPGASGEAWNGLPRDGLETLVGKTIKNRVSKEMLKTMA